MANLKGKLARLRDAGPDGRRHSVTDGEAPTPAQDDSADDDRQARLARLRAAIEGVAARQRRRAPSVPQSHRGPEPSLPGAVQQTPYGPVHAIERYLEPQHCHGRAPVRRALQVAAEHVARLALDPVLETVALDRMLMVDTETTGLAGGAGTLPFLIGMAWFEDESLRVQQLFLRRPGEEGPMLRVLAERLEAAPCIVSYNGKTFDWPLVRNRFVLNRVPMPESPPHLDLLHCARRLYKRRLGSLRLVDLERELLGFEREGDVDGSEIPGIYLRYLRGGEHTALPRVIEHNELDLVALAALVARLAEGYEELRQQDDPRDHLGYAEVAARAGDADRAGRFARAAAEGGGDASCTTRAWMLSARLARKAGDVDEEEAALRRAAEVASDELDRGETHLALAKLYEHKRKDFGRALEHAAYTGVVEGEGAQRRRIERLRRRGERQQAREER